MQSICEVGVQRKLLGVSDKSLLIRTIEWASEWTKVAQAEIKSGLFEIMDIF